MTHLRLMAPLCLVPCVVMAQVSLEAQLRFLEIAPNNPDTLYAMPARGLLRSTDAGLSWSQVPILSRNAQPPVLNSLAFSSQSPSTFFVCGPSAASSLLWRTTDGGVNFAPLTSGLPTASTRACEQIDAFGSSLYAQISGGPNASWEIYKSTNNGDTWVLLGAAPRRVTINPSSPNLMYYPSGPSIFRSSNEGQSFTSLAQISASTSSLDGVNSIAVHPTNPTLLLATLSGPTSSLNGIFRSTNGGTQWERSLSGNFVGVRFNRNSPAEAFAGPCCDGLPFYRSADTGSSWSTLAVRLGTTVVDPSPGPLVFSLPGAAGSMIAATRRGFFRSDNGGSTFTRRGTYTPSAAADTSLITAQLLTREATIARPAIQIFGAEDPNYSFSQISSAPASVPWITSATVSGSTVSPGLSARTLAPGVFSGLVRINVPSAPNSPLELPVELTVTSQIRNSYLYAGPLPDSTSAVALGTTPSGNLLYSTRFRVFELSSQGAPRLIAGGGTAEGDGPAAQAQILGIRSLAYSPQGELFIAESSSGLVRKVSRDGMLSTVAGGGRTTPSAGLNPTSVRFFFPDWIAFDPNGNLLIAESDRLWRIVNNQLQLVIGGGGSIASGTSPTNFSFSRPRGLAVAPDGRIFFTLSGSHAIFVLENNRILQFAGVANQPGPSGDGGTAFLSRLRDPSTLAFAPSGDLYFADNNQTLIRRIRPDGRIEAVMGTTTPGDPALCSVAESAPLRAVSSLLIRDGALLFADGFAAHQILLLPNTIGDPNPPSVAASGVLNGASFSSALSPGSIFSIFGQRLAARQNFAATVPLPVSLASTSVCLDGYPVPLFFTSPNQINGQIPDRVRSGEPSYLRLFTPAGVSAPIEVNLSPAAPGIFTLVDSQAIAINPDGRLNSPTSPAPPSQAIVVYLTGIGPLDNPVPANQLAPSSPLARALGPVSATVNDVPATVLFLGLTPGYIGLAQANLILPDLSPGTYNLVITVGSASTTPARITIR